LYTHFRTTGFIALWFETFYIIQVFLVLTFIRATTFNIVEELDLIRLQCRTNDIQRYR
jgi:hypothetical protein